MTPILEGKEVDKSFGNGAGKAVVDVDAKGGVIMSLSFNKEEDLDGYAKVKADISLSAETNIIVVCEKLAAKTGTKFDDSVVAGIKMLLGIME